MNDARFFLDTNLFVYALLPGEATKAARAAALIREAGLTGMGVISLQVVNEFLNVALRKFRSALDPGDAEHWLRHVFPPLVQASASLDLTASALALVARHRLAWYDALIVAAALDANCRILYSEDLQHGQTFGRLRVVNPFLEL